MEEVQHKVETPQIHSKKEIIAGREINEFLQMSLKVQQEVLLIETGVGYRWAGCSNRIMKAENLNRNRMKAKALGTSAYSL